VHWPYQWQNPLTAGFPEHGMCEIDTPCSACAQHARNNIDFPDTGLTALGGVVGIRHDTCEGADDDDLS
jgi:hypothetical protein